jgi:hypothetical protein
MHRHTRTAGLLLCACALAGRPVTATPCLRALPVAIQQRLQPEQVRNERVPCQVCLRRIAEALCGKGVHACCAAIKSHMAAAWDVQCPDRPSAAAHDG